MCLLFPIYILCVQGCCRGLPPSGRKEKETDEEEEKGTEGTLRRKRICETAIVARFGWTTKRERGSHSGACIFYRATRYHIYNPAAAAQHRRQCGTGDRKSFPYPDDDKPAVGPVVPASPSCYFARSARPTLCPALSTINMYWTPYNDQNPYSKNILYSFLYNI